MMFIERVVMAWTDAPTLLEATVGSALYAGARVPIDDLMREDRAWLARRLARALPHWLGDMPRAGDDVVLERIDDVLTLRVSGTAATAYPLLSAEQRRAVDQAVDDFLDLVQGSLVIAPGGRALTRRKGDGPA